MFKLILLAALFSVVYAGGHGNYHLGYGFTAGGGHGYGGHGHGGVANVHVQQNPHHYNYDLKEHGPGYNKYIHQSASTSHGGHYGGYGNGGGNGGFGK